MRRSASWVWALSVEGSKFDAVNDHARHAPHAGSSTPNIQHPSSNAQMKAAPCPGIWPGLRDGEIQALANRGTGTISATCAADACNVPSPFACFRAENPEPVPRGVD